MFTEQRDVTTAERRNGNGRTATEWWKPGISLGGELVRCVQCSLVLSLLLPLPLLSRHKIGTSSKRSWLQDCEFVELGP